MDGKTLKLTDWQKAALPYIKDLLSTSHLPRAIGRTELLAYIFLLLAKESNQWIDVFDHYPGQRNRETIINYIDRLSNLDEFKDYNLTVNNTYSKIRLDLKLTMPLPRDYKPFL